MRILKNSGAFSLLELIVVLVVIAIVIAIGIPGINQARNSAEIETMRSRAIALQNAKISYIGAVGTQAASTAWLNLGALSKSTATTSPEDCQRYRNILLPYLPGTAAQALTLDIPSPYVIALTNLGSSVLLTVPSSNAAGYTQYGTMAHPIQKY